MTEAAFASEKGLPFIRPLVLDFQSDRTTHFIDDEYLFGRSILVAPILIDGAQSRKVYLPEGQWRDFWSEKTFTGPGWIQRNAPLDHLLLLVKEGVAIQQTGGDDGCR